MTSSTLTKRNVQRVAHKGRGSNAAEAEAVTGEVLPIRSLDEIAADLRYEVGQAEQHLSNALDHAILAGKLLCEAKAACKRGEWIPWLEQYFPGSRSTAANWMRLAEHEQEVRAVGQSRVSDALRQLTVGTRASTRTREPKEPEAEPETKAACQVFAAAVKRETADGDDSRKLTPLVRATVKALGPELSGYLAIALADEVKRRS